jgi:hypothetical protein
MLLQLFSKKKPDHYEPLRRTIASLRKEINYLHQRNNALRKERDDATRLSMDLIVRLGLQENAHE